MPPLSDTPLPLLPLEEEAVVEEEVVPVVVALVVEELVGMAVVLLEEEEEEEEVLEEVVVEVVVVVVVVVVSWPTAETKGTLESRLRSIFTRRDGSRLLAEEAGLPGGGWRASGFTVLGAFLGPLGLLACSLLTPAQPPPPAALPPPLLTSTDGAAIARSGRPGLGAAGGQTQRSGNLPQSQRGGADTGALGTRVDVSFCLGSAPCSVLVPPPLLLRFVFVLTLGL